MCITLTSDVYVTNKDIIAFKVVRQLNETTFVSQFPPANRTSQFGLNHWVHKGCGKELFYDLGKLTKSEMPKTPGLYLYKRYRSLVPKISQCILRVKIPSKTKIRLGVDVARRHCICAEKIIPLKVVQKRR